MPWGKFFLANLSGAAVWGTVVACLGYFFGGSLAQIHHRLGEGGLILLGIALLVALSALLRRRPRSRPRRG